MPQKWTPEKQRAAMRRWRENNREKVREGHRRWCLNNREKVRESDRRWRANNRGKSRAYSLRGNYGLTLADFEALNRKQNGLCCICHKPSKKALSVDHCHNTGRVRGLLCNKCNTGLGFFNDDFSTLIRAANYIGWRSN